MDRQVTQTTALIPNSTLLGGEKAKVVGLGYALQAALGTSTAVDGLAISATSPASLSVVIGPGSIMTYAAIDPTAFGDLGVDTTHFTVKQGLLQEPGATLTLTPPAASGYSQTYLVQVQYADQDAFTVLPYYNASNPAVAYNGPNNSGASSLTLRASTCVVQLKAGTAATTGSQVAPTPDPGFTPLYLITVANGASQITASNIALYPSAPFLDLKLPQVRAAIQAQAGNYAIDIGNANSVVVSFPAYTPASLGKGTPIRVLKAGAGNTGPMTVTLNGVAYPVVTESGTALVGGEWPANALRILTFDGTSLRLGGGGYTSGNAVSAGRPNNLRVVTTSTTMMTLTADELVLSSAAGTLQRVTFVTGTIVPTVSGVGGIDTGTVAASTAYDLYGAYNPTTASFGCFATVEGNAPTPPAGYTFYRRLGWGRTDANKNWYFLQQTGDEWHYVVQPSGSSASPTAAPPVAVGQVGSNTGNTSSGAGNAINSYGAVSLSGLFPKTTIRADFVAIGLALSSNQTIIAPNGNWGFPLPAGSTSAPMYASSQDDTLACCTAQQMFCLLETAVGSAPTVYVGQQTNAALLALGGKINV